LPIYSKGRRKPFEGYCCAAEVRNGDIVRCSTVIAQVYIAVAMLCCLRKRCHTAFKVTDDTIFISYRKTLGPGMTPTSGFELCDNIGHGIPTGLRADQCS